jgi:Icc-related predicted phosphoesterase
VRLLIFSDIHGDMRALEKLMNTEADYYFAAGDLATFSRGLERGVRLFKPKADRVYVLPGNHESESDIARFCAEHGFHDFHGRKMEVDGWQIAGLGYSAPTPFNTPGEYSEDEIGRRLQPFFGLKPLVLICHCPPLDTALDQIRPGLHAGSRAVREFIEHERPEHFFCGHIHEAEGTAVQIGPTHAVNVGKIGFLLDLPQVS